MNELVDMFELYLHLYMIYTLWKSQRNKRRRGRRWWVRPLNIDRNISGYFVSTYQNMKERDPEEFFKHTRMSRPIYDLLLNLVQEGLTKRSIRPSIEFECRLAITLSFLSQGVSPKFLSWTFKVGKTTVRNIILDTCDIIWRILSPIYVSRPTEIDYMKISKDFQRRWDMPNCIGAIDGKHVEIQAPPNTGSTYYNYKKTYSIVLLAVCDARYTFTDVSVGAYGSQSDGGILKQSTFGKELFEGKLPIPKDTKLPKSNRVFTHYFVGDAAFPLRKNLMRPYPGRNLSPDKEVFNYRLSRARRIIENSFGILVSRWRVLRNSLNLLPENVEKIVLATIALHNFIHLNDHEAKYISPNFVDWEDDEHVLHSGEWRQEVNCLTSVRLGSNNAARTALNLRDELKEYLFNEGSVSFQFNRIYNKNQ